MPSWDGRNPIEQARKEAGTTMRCRSPGAPEFGLTTTSGGFARQPFRRWALVVALLTLAATPARSADDAACLELERQFEMVNRDASSLQVNETLFRACRKGCAPLARRLLGAGASVYARDRDGTMPLGYAAQSGHTALVDLLLDQGAPIDARNLAGSTALYAAAENDRAAVVDRLLARGADPNLAGRSGVSPLAAAAFKGNKPIVDLLLANGSKPNEVDATGKSAIIYAAALGFTSIVQRLLDAGVQINARYGNDLTVLMWAAGYADGAGVLDAENVVKLLLDRNADINAVDDRGRSALMIAAELDHAAIVNILLERGADRSITDKQRKTALDLATSDAVRQALQAK
jgi:uncharacterized protein